ncbi:putative membrane protein [Panicum miliaceum]|uniref:Membrane protein n=1 Tax=Panicum miliaceum TaxID=4540 RepID=A0A3L6QJ30_PANMI|nr:putative membrane protein [Panicum miliaceum]
MAAGIWISVWSFFKFLPFFFALLLLGIIKGALFGPWAWLIMTIGISALILGLWPMHVIWTYYCIIRTKMVGPVVKLLLLIAVTVILVLWLIMGIMGSILAGLAYGFLAPAMATFDAVGEGKEKPLLHCFLDGTWSTITGSCTVVRDVKDMLMHSYFSIMDEVCLHAPPDGKPYEIRLLHIPGAILAAACGLVVDAIMFALIALYKFPVMLFKGWKRLIEDLVGREGPFLETACVPFAGLAILLWPFAVIGAFLASIICSVPFGAYAAVVVYQESSLFLGLSYVVSSVSIFDEYTNDVLDMAPGSCFPRFKYRKDEASSHSGSLSRPTSFKDNHDVKKVPQRVTSFKSSFDEFNPFKLLDLLFIECKHHGKDLVAEGVITPKDIEGTKAGKVSTGVLNVGLPAYVILKALLRSARANSDGLVLSDGSEITSDNRPKSKLFEWFFDPLMVIKDQIKAENFTEEEEAYLEKQVLLISDPKRVKENLIRLPSLSEQKQAEIEAFARRLQGITKSISRYPTAKRRFDVLVKALSEELARTMGGSESANGSQVRKVRSSIVRMLSQRSLGKTTGIRGDDHEAQLTSDVNTD